MSTLKVSAINNAAAGSGGLAISTAGLVSGAGMDLIVTQTFSAVGSVNVNNCFSSTYDNYRILIQPTAVSASDIGGTIRLRVGGTDDSTASSYLAQRNGTFATTQEADLATGTNWNVMYLNSTSPEFCVSDIELFKPFTATKTSARIQRPTTTGGNYYSTYFTALHTQAVSYDGFSITLASGNFTGTLRVYGYRN